MRGLEAERDGLVEFAARAAHELVAPLVITEVYSAIGVAPAPGQPLLVRAARLARGA